MSDFVAAVLPSPDGAADPPAADALIEDDREVTITSKYFSRFAASD